MVTGYSYDASGNLTHDGLNALAYDAENRLVTSSGGTYTYDGNGLRVVKVAGGTTTVYIFSGAKVIAEYENSAAPGAPTREYIYSGSALLAKIEAGATNYYHPDHLSVRLVTDSSGNIAGQQGHYPFGEAWYAASTTTKWEFTSYERDAESGNDYALARYHVNRLGRFSSPDPLAGSVTDPQSLNRYAYVRNDPVNLTDPRGSRYDMCGICSGVGGYDPNAVTFILDGVEMPSFDNGFFEHELGLGFGFAPCPDNTCEVTAPNGQPAYYRAYADNSSGYETNDFLGYSPADILDTAAQVQAALRNAPVDWSNLTDAQRRLVKRLAAILRIPLDQIQVYATNDGNVRVMVSSANLDTLQAMDLGNSSLFHRVYSVDTRENTSNNQNSLHITMLDPSLTTLLGVPELLFIDMHNDLYNPRQDLLGHICQVIGACH